MGRATKQKPWYKDGLKFKCTGCGNCCTGAPGYVWVNQVEIDALAELMDMEVQSFQDQYVRKVGSRRSLKEFPNGDCVFFDVDQRTCQVYDARPRQCRTWPFWHSNLKTPEDWEQTCQECPGSGKGALYQLGQIEAQRKVVKI